MEIKGLLKSVVEEIWLNEIKDDYNNDLIINEETLKTSFCFHLRNKLTTSFLLENKIRIIPELKIKSLGNEKSDFRVDIAIVRVDEEREKFFHISEFTKSVLALIELKFIPIRHYHLNQWFNMEDFKKMDNDFLKLEKCGNACNEAWLIGAFVHENFYNHMNGMHRLFDISHILDEGLLERFIELNGFNYNETGSFMTTIR